MSARACGLRAVARVGVMGLPCPVAALHGAYLAQSLQFAHPFVERVMERWFAGEDEAAAEFQQALAEGLVGIQIIAQHNDPPRSVMRSPTIKPTTGRSQFAILLLRPILWVKMNSGASGTIRCWPGATSTGVSAV